MESTGTTIQVEGTDRSVRAYVMEMALLSRNTRRAVTPCPAGATLTTQGTCKEKLP